MNKAQQKSQTITEIIRSRKIKAAIQEGYIQLFSRIIVIAIIALIVFTQFFFVSRTAGNAMFPAVKDGDVIIGFRLERNFESGDIVRYEVDGEKHLGRILGQDSDIITIDDSGTLLVNGTAQDGEIFFPTYRKEGNEYPYRVPAKSVFILGDYRTQTLDSRDFGPIATDDVDGKVISLFRRRGL